MGIKSNLLITSALVLSSSANAALIERLGGLAYYDDVNDLTWLADANAAGTTMTWDAADAWAAGLDVAGVTGWRLPDTIQPDPSCNSTDGFGQDIGYFCTGSEMGNLFYNVLGGLDLLPISVVHDVNYDLFSNVQDDIYWSGTEYAPTTPLDAWYFDMGMGYQDSISKTFTSYAWAVQSGDVSPVPVPAAAWLFGSGLIGLIGVARRRR